MENAIFLLPFVARTARDATASVQAQGLIETGRPGDEGQGHVARPHKAVARSHDAHDAIGRFGEGHCVVRGGGPGFRSALVNRHDLFRRLETDRVWRKVFLLPSGGKYRHPLRGCGRAPFATCGLLELFTGGVELLLSQLAIAIRIRLRKPLE